MRRYFRCFLCKYKPDKNEVTKLQTIGRYVILNNKLAGMTLK